MIFFRRKKHKSKLGTMLVSSGSLWKAGEEASRRDLQSLDDVYGWSDDFPMHKGDDYRTGLPAIKRRKADRSM